MLLREDNLTNNFIVLFSRKIIIIMKTKHISWSIFITIIIVQLLYTITIQKDYIYTSILWSRNTLRHYFAYWVKCTIVNREIRKRSELVVKHSEFRVLIIYKLWFHCIDFFQKRNIICMCLFYRWRVKYIFSLRQKIYSWIVLCIVSEENLFFLKSRRRFRILW